MEKSVKWYRSHDLLLEGFVLLNLAFLGLDIFLAHSTNSFRHSAEYVPFIFSLIAPLVLSTAIVARRVRFRWNLWRVLGYGVGAIAVAVGTAGLVWHLESRFFREFTLESLVYTAPFAAPLAYTGLGLLLVVNRMVESKSVEWAQWVCLLAWGGFVGNFVFSLADHAQNGFFHWTEWIPVVSSAFAVGFLIAPFCVSVNRRFLNACFGVLFLQALVGILGFWFHSAANLHGPSPRVFENFVNGAPAMAPLLFPNLVVLAFLGLCAWRRHLPTA